MISPIGSTGLARAIQLPGEGVAKGEAAKTAGAGTPAPTTAAAAAPANPAAEMAAAGAPIDTDKVAAIRSAIAQGTYKVDPKAIAARMIALDMPAKG